MAFAAVAASGPGRDWAPWLQWRKRRHGNAPINAHGAYGHDDTAGGTPRLDPPTGSGYADPDPDPDDSAHDQRSDNRVNPLFESDDDHDAAVRRTLSAPASHHLNNTGCAGPVDNATSAPRH